MCSACICRVYLLPLLGLVESWGREDIVKWKETQVQKGSALERREEREKEIPARKPHLSGGTTCMHAASSLFVTSGRCTYAE